MSETMNYGLYLTDDNTTKFLEWRTKMNGTEDSNMVKIDKVLGEKANRSVLISYTLAANKWVNGEQTLTIAGLTSKQNGAIGIAQDISKSQIEAVYAAGFYVSGQADGVLTVSVNGDVPSEDIPVVIILLG